MQDATLLRLALTKQFGSAGSAHYIKIGDGRLCMQWPHAAGFAHACGALRLGGGAS